MWKWYEKASKAKREGPLVEFYNPDELRAWLQKRPREMAVVFAARAALRVLPLLQEASHYKPDYIVLPVFRALAFAWANARCRLAGDALCRRRYAANRSDTARPTYTSATIGISALMTPGGAARAWHESLVPHLREFDS